MIPDCCETHIQQEGHQAPRTRLVVFVAEVEDPTEHSQCQAGEGPQPSDEALLEQHAKEWRESAEGLTDEVIDLTASGEESEGEDSPTVDPVSYHRPIVWLGPDGKPSTRPEDIPDV